MEGQIWIALYNLLSKPQSAEKYEIGEYRKGILLKSLRYLNEEVENQLSFLSGFKKWLLKLQMGSAPPAKSATLFIEAVAEIREDLIKR